MTAQLDAAALTKLFEKAHSDLRRTRSFYLREAQALKSQTDDPRQVSRGLRRVAHELMKMSEQLLRVRALARDCLTEGGAVDGDMERLCRELEDDFLGLLREDREVLCRGRGIGAG